MAVYVCKKCGNSVIWDGAEKVSFCPKCGSTQMMQSSFDADNGSVADREAQNGASSAPGASDSPLLRRAFIFIEDGKWAEANDYCEKVLDQDPENARAYLGKLMIDMKVREPYILANCAHPFDTNENYRKVIRFGDEELRKEIIGYNSHVAERNEGFDFAEAYRSGGNKTATSGGSGGGASGTERWGRIVDLVLAAVALMFLLSPMAFTFAGGYISLLNTGLVFSVLSDTFLIIAAVLAFLAVVVFLAYAVLWILRFKKEEAPITRVLRIAFYSIGILAVIFTFFAVEDLKSLTGGYGTYLAAGWYIATLLCAFGLFAALAPALLDNKAGLITRAAVAALCVVLFFVFCLGPIVSAGSIPDVADIGLGDVSLKQGEVPDIEPGTSYKSAKQKIEKAGLICVKVEIPDSDVAEGNVIRTDPAPGSSAVGGSVVVYVSSGSGGGGNGGSGSTVNVGYYIGMSYNELVSSLAADGLVINSVTYVASDQPYGTVVDQYPYPYTSVSAGSSVDVNLSDGSLAVAVGDTMTMGYYEQDGNYSNGAEPIEWVVLKVEDGSALLTSKYALDVIEYNSYYDYTTWETSTIRSWLNNTFYHSAFSYSEQGKIENRKMPAYKNRVYDTDPGNDTYDNVFLLSMDAADKFFSSDAARACGPTAYARSRGVYVDGYNCWWWLRPPGANSYAASVVDPNGAMNYEGADVNFYGVGVRPAIWVTLGS